MNARDHIRTAHSFLDFGNDEGPQPSLAIAHALLSIACTLADMADMDADTRTQPAIKPAAPTRLELIDKVEQTLRLFTAEDPVRNIAIAVTNTVQGAPHYELYMPSDGRTHDQS